MSVFSKVQKLHLNRVFLWLFIPLSLMMMLVMPITRTPDEPAHLLQTYTIADGQLISSLTTSSVMVPENFSLPNSGATFSYADLRATRDVSLSSNRVTIDLPVATAIYPPVSYFPQALGMRLAMLFTDNILALQYSARIANWLVATLLLYTSLRLLPSNRMLFIYLALLPMNLQQIISASADGVAIALVYTLSAFVMHCREKRPRFTAKYYLGMLLLSIGVCCWKVFYTPMILLLLFIPADCFISRGKKRLALGCIIGINVVLLASWALVCYFTMFKDSDAGLTGQTMSGFTTFLQNPMDFLVKLFNALKKYWVYYVFHVFGYRLALSWYNICPGFFLAAASIITLCLFLFADDTKTWRPGYRIGSLGFALVCILISFFMLYLWWTPAEYTYIDGFQARYMLPLLFPVGIAIWQAPKWKISHRLPLLALVVAVDLGYLYQIVTQIA